MLRQEGLPVGLLRPITLNPFPYKAFEKIDYGKCRGILDVEMSIPAQFLRDVSIGVKDRCPIGTCLCSGGNIMTRESIIEAAKKSLEA